MRMSHRLKLDCVFVLVYFLVINVNGFLTTSSKHTTAIRSYGRTRKKHIDVRSSPHPTPTALTTLNHSDDTDDFKIGISLNDVTDSPSDDGLGEFSNDVSTVLHELRSSQTDPTLPAIFTNNMDLTFTNIWTLSHWEKHNTRWRYWRDFARLPKSRLIRRMLPQLSILFAWSTIVVMSPLNCFAALNGLEFPLTSLSLISTFIAALETLRSNQGLSRLYEARLAWGRAVLLARDTADIIARYVYPKDKELGLLAARYISLFGWLLKGHVREEPTLGNCCDIVTTVLPTKQDVYYVLMNQQRTPMVIISRIRQILSSVADRKLLPPPVHGALERNLRDMDNVITTCDRIRGTPVPPLYTSHACRLLVLYLFFLPLALHGQNLQKVLTVLTSTFVGFALLGLDEISHILEQPFKLMPLYQLSKMVMEDVRVAYVHQPPPLPTSSPSSTQSSSSTLFKVHGKRNRIQH